MGGLFSQLKSVEYDENAITEYVSPKYCLITNIEGIKILYKIKIFRDSNDLKKSKKRFNCIIVYWDVSKNNELARLNNILIDLKSVAKYVNLFVACSSKQTLNLDKYNLGRYTYVLYDKSPLYTPITLYKINKYLVLDNDPYKHQNWLIHTSFIQSCGKNRLIQLSGSCWINSAFNGILLNKPLLDCIIPLLNKKDDVEINDKLSLCSYIKALLYNVLQKDTFRGTFKETDILNSLSNKIKNAFFSENLTKALVHINGGIASMELYAILYCLFDKRVHFISRLFVNMATNITTELTDSTKFLIVEEKSIYKYKIHNGVKYTHIFSMFACKYYDNETDTFKGHAIIGYTCNGFRFIYDSNGVNIPINWLDMDKLTHLKYRYHNNDSYIKFDHIEYNLYMQV